MGHAGLGMGAGRSREGGMHKEQEREVLVFSDLEQGKANWGE